MPSTRSAGPLNAPAPVGAMAAGTARAAAVRIAVQGQRHGAVAEQVLNQLRMHPSLQQDGRCRVPKIVYPNARQPGSVKSDLQGIGGGAGLRRLALAVRKDELTLGP